MLLLNVLPMNEPTLYLQELMRPPRAKKRVRRRSRTKRKAKRMRRKKRARRPQSKGKRKRRKVLITLWLEQILWTKKCDCWS